MVLAPGRPTHARLPATDGRNPRRDPQRHSAYRDTSRVRFAGLAKGVENLIHMAKTKDYYDVLGVPRTATSKEITSAFRKLARQHHPDLNAGDKQAEAKFKEISEAHDVLSDAKSRKLYDEFGADWRSAQQAGVQPGTGGRSAGGGYRPQPQGGPGVQYRTVTPDEMEDMFGDSGSFGDIFGSIFGNSARTRTRPAPIDVEA